MSFLFIIFKYVHPRVKRVQRIQKIIWLEIKNILLYSYNLCLILFDYKFFFFFAFFFLPGYNIIYLRVNRIE